jgi:hypothetical protein
VNIVLTTELPLEKQQRPERPKALQVTAARFNQLLR